MAESTSSGSKRSADQGWYMISVSFFIDRCMFRKLGRFWHR